MGVELFLSLHSAPLNGASSFSVCKVLLEHSLDSPRRRQCAVAAEVRNSNFSSNLEGNSDCRFHSSLDNHHPHPQNYQKHQHFHHYQHHPFHHHQLPHPWQGSLDVRRHSRRLGSGFSIAAESDSSDTDKPEHGHCLYNFNCSSSIEGNPIAANHACAGGFVATGVDLPLSFRMLKRKQQDFGKPSLASGLSKVGNSLRNAFSSVVYMMKTLQSHTLYIRQQYFKQEVEGLLSQVHQEMHVSFLWLFQQVFSCTPELMVLIMVFLADCTTFFMANNIPLLPPISMYTPPVSIASTLSNSIQSSDEGLRVYFNMSFKASPSVANKADGTYNDGGYAGNGGRRIYHINRGGDDGDPDFYNISMNLNKALYTVDDNLPTELSSKAAASVSSLHENSTSQVGLPPNDLLSSTENLMPSEFSDMAAALAFQELMTSEGLFQGEALSPANNNDVVLYGEAANDAVDYVEATGTKEVTGTSNHVFLDQGTMQNLVSPFSVRLEDDDYSCYDRLPSRGIHHSTNPMLLANYAQFLFLVRKDHDRAEELFRKAVLCDPFDCDAISRFTSFLWLAWHNLLGAEKAYQSNITCGSHQFFSCSKLCTFHLELRPVVFDVG